MHFFWQIRFVFAVWNVKILAMGNILVISNCRLGDSLVMIPALRSIKAQWPEAHITLMSEATGAGIVSAEEILGGRGLVDEFVKMPFEGGFFRRLLGRLQCFRQMRRHAWDCGVVLLPPCPPLTMRLVRRLRLYLRLCGCRRIIAPQAIFPFERNADGSLKPMPQVAELMLEMLSSQGIMTVKDGTLPPLARPSSIALLPEKAHLAVAPGANMPVKCWPVGNYAIVLKEILARYNLRPVYFAGENERGLCEELDRMVPGETVIGRPLPEVEGAMRQCRAYFGNDTGLIHLAASLGLPCIGIYANRNAPGLWEPYAAKKLVLWPKAASCAGCQRTICSRHCIDEIRPRQVLEAINKSGILL